MKTNVNPPFLTDDGADAAANEEEAGGDAPDADEPNAEESSSAGAGESGATPKIIISWIVGSVQKCKQCGNEKNCGFRYKKPEESEDQNKDKDKGEENAEEEPPQEPASSGFEYICDTACVNALIADQPGKYFVRRKKFLVEEVVREEGAAEAEAETEAEEAGEDATPANTHDCLQCKEQTRCKYFINVCVHILGGKGVRPWPADSPRAAIVIDRRDALTICCLFFSLPFDVFCSFLMSI